MMWEPVFLLLPHRMVQAVLPHMIHQSEDRAFFKIGMTSLSSSIRAAGVRERTERKNTGELCDQQDEC